MVEVPIWVLVTMSLALALVSTMLLRMLVDTLNAETIPAADEG